MIREKTFFRKFGEFNITPADIYDKKGDTTPAAAAAKGFCREDDLSAHIIDGLDGNVMILCERGKSI